MPIFCIYLPQIMDSNILASIHYLISSTWDAIHLHRRSRKKVHSRTIRTALVEANEKARPEVVRRASQEAALRGKSNFRCLQILLMYLKTHYM